MTDQETIPDRKTEPQKKEKSPEAERPPEPPNNPLRQRAMTISCAVPAECCWEPSRWFS